MISERVINSWKLASKDLNIKIQSPFILTTKNNKKVQFDLLVEKFGSKNGMIIFSFNKMHDIKLLIENDYSYSGLFLRSYSTYNRQHFIDTLNDWGYFGDVANTPDWYTGQPWGE